MKNTKDITIRETIVTANPGSTLANCVQECLELAAREWHTIAIIHNQCKYKIDPNSIYTMILKTKEESK